MEPDSALYKETYLLNHPALSPKARGIRCYAYFDSLFKVGFRSEHANNYYCVIALVVSGEYKSRRAGSKEFHSYKEGSFSMSIPNGQIVETRVAKRPCIRKGLIFYPTEMYRTLLQNYFMTETGFRTQLADKAPVEKLFNAIKTEFKKAPEPLDEIRIAGLIIEILETVLAQQTAPEPDEYPADFAGIIRYIKARLADHTLNREQIAADAGLSVRNLSRLFQKYMKMSISQYIMESRLKLAANMVLLPNLRINEIADKCGFGSSIYLTRIFKAYYKMTPREYRQRHNAFN